MLSLVSMARIFGKVWYYLTLWAWGTTTLLIVAIVWTVATGASVPGTDARRVGPDGAADRR